MPNNVQAIHYQRVRIRPDAVGKPIRQTVMRFLRINARRKDVRKKMSKHRVQFWMRQHVRQNQDVRLLMIFATVTEVGTSRNARILAARIAKQHADFKVAEMRAGTARTKAKGVLIRRQGKDDVLGRRTAQH